MGVEPKHDWQQAMQSALSWWRDAGVDALVDDDPRNWMAPPRPVAGTVATGPAAASAVPAALPPSFDAFVEWRMGPQAPEAGWHAPRIAPAGPIHPGWMVLVDMPENDDSAAGMLLSGAPGRLFDNMLAAIGESRASIHLASLATARPATGRVPPEQLDALAEIALRHIALVAPRRVLVLGMAASRVFGATGDSVERGRLRAINHSGGQSAAILSYGPGFLLDHPTAKADAWKHLQLLLTGGNSQ
ncbi:MAG: uracil-DNA glycosylase family protein [Pseudomonadota bacterium]